ncbi:MAG: DUF3418 domain-containing protein, partial [Moraxellaceae bacterium]
VDNYYRFNIKVVDDKGKVVASGRDLLPLREKYRAQVQQNIQSAATNIERDDITQWDFETLPQAVQLQRNGIGIRAYPALVDKTTSVALQVLDNPQQALELTQRGLARLLFLQLNQAVKYLQKELLKDQDIALTFAGIGSRDQVADDIILAAIKQLALSDQNSLPRNKIDFDKLVESIRDKIVAHAQEICAHLLASLKLLVEVRKNIKQQKNALVLAFALSDIQEQLKQLFYVGLVYKTPDEWLRQYPRYLRAIQMRLEKAVLNPQKDKLTLMDIQPYWQRLQSYVENTWFKQLLVLRPNMSVVG